MPQLQCRCRRFWALSWIFFSLSHWTSGLEECQQVGIELLLVSLRQAVGCACILPQVSCAEIPETLSLSWTTFQVVPAKTPSTSCQFPPTCVCPWAGYLF